MLLSPRIKDAGIAIRHSRGYTLFYSICAGSGNGLEGNELLCPPKLTLRKICFLIEKYIADARQDEKTRPGSAGIDNEAH